jgi:hypothetical protein
MPTSSINEQFLFYNQKEIFFFKLKNCKIKSNFKIFELKYYRTRSSEVSFFSYAIPFPN